ncbi:MAG: hypothetical protein GY913_29615 [Proteobacteria bacterium]|nr:hypothetical protein [Pseudomonadota bacterium]MCP4921074.1 hypothetical protein [Pseudomonadota bacterium]
MLIALVGCLTPPSDQVWETVGFDHQDAGTAAPLFELEDINASSATFGEFVGPATQAGQVSAWYFGHAT